MEETRIMPASVFRPISPDAVKCSYGVISTQSAERYRDGLTGKWRRLSGSEMSKAGELLACRP